MLRPEDADHLRREVQAIVARAVTEERRLLRECLETVCFPEREEAQWAKEKLLESFDAECKVRQP